VLGRLKVSVVVVALRKVPPTGWQVVVVVVVPVLVRTGPASGAPSNRYQYWVFGDRPPTTIVGWARLPEPVPATTLPAGSEYTVTLKIACGRQLEPGTWKVIEVLVTELTVPLGGTQAVVVVVVVVAFRVETGPRIALPS
jgi:hypothetical protein